MTVFIASTKGANEVTEIVDRKYSTQQAVFAKNGQTVVTSASAIWQL